MIWILILLFFIIIVLTIIISIYYSNVVLDIPEYYIFYNENNKKKLNIKEFKMSIQIYLFKKIKILNIKIYEDYCEIFKIKIHLNVLKKLKDDDERGTIYVIRNILKLNPEIKKLDLELLLGTEDMIITTFAVPVISTAISFFITKYMSYENIYKDNAISNYRFKIVPKYIDTNEFILKGSIKISFDALKVLFFIKKHREIKK